MVAILRALSLVDFATGTPLVSVVIVHGLYLSLRRFIVVLTIRYTANSAAVACVFA